VAELLRYEFTQVQISLLRRQALYFCGAVRWDGLFMMVPGLANRIMILYPP
jgi:hypothetical protein